MTKSPSKSVANSNTSSRRSAAKQRRKGVSTAVAAVTTADGHHQATAHPSDHANATDGNTKMASCLHHSGTGNQHHQSGMPVPDSLSQQGSTIPAASAKDDIQHAAHTAVATAEGEVSSRHHPPAADLGQPRAAAQTHAPPLQTGSHLDRSDAAASEDLQHASSLTAAAAATPADRQNLASPLAKASTTSSTSSSGNNNSSWEITTDAGSLLIRPSKRTPAQISAIAHDHSEGHGLSIHSGEGGSQSSGHNGAQGAGQAHGGPQEASLGNRPTAMAADAEAAAVAASGHGQLVSSLKLSQKPVFPSIGATAALVHAFAIADDIHQCDR